MSAERLQLLRAAVRDYQGEWTTHRVQHFYRARGVDAPKRATARAGLAQLVREGLLLLDDTTPWRRVFRLNRISTRGAA
ncbi:hypothetical protein [Streptomyces sp. CC228A]|uniref:hypothetical protein n=1 Tax=Streptomyces sp. CC228A TaxID=2898186 RepID=UPI001F38E794|nr:hypothetical protein [Streptomyces sp. CC228A]